MPARDRNLYGGSYRRRRAKLIAWAKSNPHLARCWRCEQPLATCGPNKDGRHKNGSPAHWTAGHPTHDPGDVLMLECSPCNYAEGAQHGNARRPKTPKRRRR